MTNGTRWVGLDVHAAQTACAVLDSHSGEVITRRIVGRPHEVMGFLEQLEPPVRAVHEAGPTGYVLAICRQPECRFALARLQIRDHLACKSAEVPGSILRREFRLGVCRAPRARACRSGAR
jgi:hypothetical protein